VILILFLLHSVMKNLEKDKLETLLQIIGTNPSLQIAHFTQGEDTLTEALHDYCQKEEYFYQLNCTTDDGSVEMLSEKYKDDTKTQVRELPLERNSYMKQAKQYDFVFVTNEVNERLRDDFLKKVHRIILNAGNLILFIDKDNRSERYQWIALLEENNYVATSTIDDLFENYDVIISKKMHGWGSL